MTFRWRGQDRERFLIHSMTEIDFKYSTLSANRLKTDSKMPSLYTQLIMSPGSEIAWVISPTPLKTLRMILMTLCATAVCEWKGSLAYKFTGMEISTLGLWFLKVQTEAPPTKGWIFKNVTCNCLNEISLEGKDSLVVHTRPSKTWPLHRIHH